MTLTERLTFLLGFAVIVGLGMVCSGCVTRSKYDRDLKLMALTRAEWLKYNIDFERRIQALERIIAEESREREVRSQGGNMLNDLKKYEFHQTIPGYIDVYPKEKP